MTKMTVTESARQRKRPRHNDFGRADRGSDLFFGRVGIGIRKIRKRLLHGCVPLIRFLDGKPVRFSYKRWNTAMGKARQDA